MIGTARAPGTCGELVQGKINGINFLVTCPVDLHSIVTVKLNKSGEIQVAENLPKVRMAVEKTLHFLNVPEMGAEVSVLSTIPCGKGMASSTADISAACAAVAAGLGIGLNAREAAQIALAIEPTDGLMFPGIAMFDHIEGKVARILGHAPDLEVIIVDLGGTVDTVGFNANAELDMMNRLKESKVASALEKLERALASGDAGLIGEAATESAFANQHILFKPELERLFEICRQAGGVGVNVAHSGTVVGLLFETGRDHPGKALPILTGAGFHILTKVRLIDGGVEVLQERAGDPVWHHLNTSTAETCGRPRKNTG